VVPWGRPWLWLCIGSIGICVGPWAGAIPIPAGGSVPTGDRLSEGNEGNEGSNDADGKGVEGKVAVGLVLGSSATDPESQFRSREPQSGQVSSAQETFGGCGTSLPQIGQ